MYARNITVYILQKNVIICNVMFTCKCGADGFRMFRFMRWFGVTVIITFLYRYALLRPIVLEFYELKRALKNT